MARDRFRRWLLRCVMLPALTGFAALGCGEPAGAANITASINPTYRDGDVTRLGKQCSGIDVWMDDLIVGPGANVLMPVYIEDATGWGIMAFDVGICWCNQPAGLLGYEFCLPGEVMVNSGWGDPVCGQCVEGCSSIEGAGTRPLVGGGVLFYVKFNVSANAKPCMYCDLWFTHVNLYDPEDPLDVCWEDGRIYIRRSDIFGTVNYWKCCYDECDEPYLARWLTGAFVHLMDCEGNPVASQYTDDTGQYSFRCLSPFSSGCPYCVSVNYCPVVQCVTSMDAALVLHNIVCLDDLDDCPFPWAGGTVYPQQVAADVNCSGMITSLDASYILQHAVGLIDVFPCPDMWKFYAIQGSCASTIRDTLDWIGVMYGDVNGCRACPGDDWRLAGVAPRVSVTLAPATYYDDRVEIPVRAKNSQDVMAVDLVVNYDTADLAVVSVEETGLAGDFSLAYNPVSGELRIAMAGTATFSGTGTIATLTFEEQGTVPMILDKVSISEAYFNDIAVRVEGNVTERKVAFGLGPIAPNPFVDGTSVKFSMAKSASVTLSIYNVNGQLVKTLVDGQVGAGQQQVVWDGRDMSGQKAARGVYFCRMATDGFTTTTKVVSME